MAELTKILGSNSQLAILEQRKTNDAQQTKKRRKADAQEKEKKLCTEDDNASLPDGYDFEVYDENKDEDSEFREKRRKNSAIAKQMREQKAKEELRAFEISLAVSIAP